MSAASVNIEIPLEALRAAVSSLNAEDKRQLAAMLDEQLMSEDGVAEEVEAIAEARAQLDAGQYVTLDDFTSGRRTP